MQWFGIVSCVVMWGGVGVWWGVMWWVGWGGVGEVGWDGLGAGVVWGRPFFIGALAFLSSINSMISEAVHACSFHPSHAFLTPVGGL